MPDTPKETVLNLAPDQRTLTIPGLAADGKYRVEIEAFRVVDQDIDADGVIESNVAVAPASPYQPTPTVKLGDGVLSGSTPIKTVVDASKDANGRVVPITEILGSVSDLKTTYGDTVSSKANADAAAASQAVAQTAASNASTASDAAKAARDAAAASQATALSNANTATSAKNDAQTALSSTQAALTNANAAKTAAETARTNAQTAQTASEAAKTLSQSAQSAAQTAATNASTSATTASTSATSAKLAGAALLPSDFANKGLFWQTGSGGAPGSVGSPSDALFTSVSGIGTVYNINGAFQIIANMGVFKPVAGRTYDVEAGVKILSDNTAGGNSNTTLQFVGLNESYVENAYVSGIVAGFPASQNNRPTDANFVVWKARYVTAATPGSAWLRPRFYSNYSGGTGANGNQNVQLSYLKVTDVTDVLAAAGSATAAAGSASTATTKATEAGTSATSATGSANTATTKAQNASDSATAASTSASAASGSATTAGQSASAAQTSAQTATTKAGEASTSATSAAGSSSDATGSKNAAATSASQAANSATAAGGSATAANTSAGSASTSATNAGNSATAANASAVNAASSFNAANLTAASEMPADFNLDGQFFTSQFGVSPATAPQLTANSTFSYQTVTAIGRVLQVSVGPGASVNSANLSAIRLIAGRKYRVSTRVRLTAAATGCTSILYAMALDANYGFVSTASASGIVTPSTTWADITAIIDGSTAIAAGGVWLRANIATNTSTAAPATSVFQYQFLLVEDVTESLAAASSATAAAGSASTASTKADAAGQSATAANTSATNAATSAGAAGTSAGNAATSANASSSSASDALASKNAAGTSATNAATSATQAGGSATAAGTSATNAGTSATQAGNSATAANTSAVSAASSYTNANQTVVTTLPSDFSLDGRFFKAGYSGDPVSSTPIGSGTGAYTFATVSGIGRVIQVVSASSVDFSTVGMMNLVPNRKYRITTSVRLTAAANGTVSAGLWGLGNNATFGNVNNTSTSLVPTTTWQTLTLIVDANTLIAGGAAWLQPMVRSTASASNAFQYQFLKIEDVTSEINAATSATAAAGSASTASTKADVAGQSATAASGSATAASTSAGNASTSAGQASTSASDALSSKNSAASSATTSAAARDDAATSASAAASSATTAAASKDAAGQSASSANTSATNAATKAGEASTSASNASTSASNASGSANTATTQADLASTSKTGADSAKTAAQAAQTAAENAKTAAQGSATAANTSASTASTKADAANTSASAANTSALAASASKDAASGSATNAATAASTASTKADSATGSASTANTAASNAASYRDAASTSATNAQTSANNASGSAATATAQAIISTSYSGTSINLNDKFANWPDASGYPANWSTWSGSGTYRIERQAGLGSAYSLRTLNDTPNVSSGFGQPVTLYKGAWVIEATVALDGGNWIGAGVSVSGVWKLDFSLEADSSGLVASTTDVGTVRTWSKLFNFNNEFGASATLYGMLGWTSFNAGPSPKYLRWYNLRIRPATSLEIATNKAVADIAASAASISALQSTSASQGSSLATLSTTVQARTTAGGNLIKNSDFLNGMTNSWGNYSTGINPNWQFSVNAAGDTWHPAGENTLSVFQPGRIGAEAYGRWFCERVSVTPGTYIQAYVFAASHRSQVHMNLEFYDANGTYLTATIGGNQDSGPGGNTGDKFKQMGHLAVLVPANAATVTMVIGKFDGNATSGDTSSYAWFWRPFIGAARQGQTEWNPYAPGTGSAILTAVNAQVQTTASTVAGIDGRTQAYWETVANAGANATAFIQAKAKSADGVSDSTVAMGAKEIHLYNQADGGFKKALSIVGGNAEFTGGLSAGAYIRLGSGAQWNVALRQQDFAVYDGQVVSFGTNLGNLPQLSFAGNNLAPLSSGQTYSLYAENLTPTGFTARLRIITPAAPANFNLGPGSNPGSGPTYQIDKAGNPDSQDGTYNLVFNTSVTMSPSSVEDYR